MLRRQFLSMLLAAFSSAAAAIDDSDDSLDPILVSCVGTQPYVIGVSSSTGEWTVWNTSSGNKSLRRAFLPFVFHIGSTPDNHIWFFGQREPGSDDAPIEALRTSREGPMMSSRVEFGRHNQPCVISDHVLALRYNSGSANDALQDTVTFNRTSDGELELLSTYRCDPEWHIHALVPNSQKSAIAVLRSNRATGPTPRSEGDIKVVLINVASGTQMASTGVYKNTPIRGIQSFPSSHRAVVFGPDFIQILEVPSLRVVHRRRLSDKMLGADACALSHDGRFVVFGRVTLKLWDISSDKLVELDSLDSAEIPKIWDDFRRDPSPSSDQALMRIRQKCISYISFVGESHKCVVATWSGNASVWDVGRRTVLATTSLVRDK